MMLAVQWSADFFGGDPDWGRVGEEACSSHCLRTGNRAGSLVGGSVGGPTSFTRIYRWLSSLEFHGFTSPSLGKHIFFFVRSVRFAFILWSWGVFSSSSVFFRLSPSPVVCFLRAFHRYSLLPQDLIGVPHLVVVRRLVSRRGYFLFWCEIWPARPRALQKTSDPICGRCSLADSSAATGDPTILPVVFFNAPSNFVFALFHVCASKGVTGRCATASRGGRSRGCPGVCTCGAGAPAVRRPSRRSPRRYKRHQRPRGLRRVLRRGRIATRQHRSGSSSL